MSQAEQNLDRQWAVSESQPGVKLTNNQRKRRNKKAAAAAAAAAAQVAEAAAPQPYIHSFACLEHSAQRPLAWGPEPEGGCLCAGILATQAANRAVAAGLRPACQPYEGMSCAYGGSVGCSYCVSVDLPSGSPLPPPALLLSGWPRNDKPRFAVSGRSGECSPDCCCPYGVSCGDRSTPIWAQGSTNTSM
jgi:hypothetical protein